MSRLDAIERASKDRDDMYVSYFDKDFLEERGIQQIVAADGDNFFAIIPPKDDDQYFGFKFYAHYDVGPNRDRFLCPRRTNNGRCPLCEEYMRTKDDNLTDDEMKPLKSSLRYLFFVVDMASAETQAEGVKLLEVPKTVNDELLVLSTDRRTGAVIDVSDPTDGKLLIYTRTGKGLGTKYSGFVLEDRDPLLQSWSEDVPEFDEVVVVPSYDDIKEAYFGPDETEKPVEEAPAPSRERRRRTVETPVAEVLAEVEKDLTDGDDDDMAKTIERLKAKLAKRKAEEE